MTMRHRHRPRTLGVALSAVIALGALVGAPAALADLSISVVPAGPLGPFVPGVAAQYTTSAAATVTTDTDAILTIADTSGVGIPGVLYNEVGGMSLNTPLEASGSSTAVGATGSPFEPLSATPLTLVTYSQPVTDDPVTIDLMQAIGATDPLRSGNYSKVLTLTLTEGP